MSAFSRHTIETPHVGNVFLPGAWRPNLASATAAANIHANWISSVAHTSTGVYTITMKDAFKKLNLVSVIATLRMGTWDDSIAQVAAVDMAAGTIVVNTAKEAAGALALTDIADDASNWVDMILVAQYNNCIDGSNVQ